jgi:hypothetical protein
MTLFERTYFTESKLDDAVRKYHLTPIAEQFLRSIDPELKYQNKYVDWFAKIISLSLRYPREGFENVDGTVPTLFGYTAEEIAYMLSIWNSTGKRLSTDLGFDDFAKIAQSKKSYIRKIENSRHAQVLFKSPEYSLIWLKTPNGANALFGNRTSWCIASSDYDTEFMFEGLYVVVLRSVDDPWDAVCIQMGEDGGLHEMWNSYNIPTYVTPDITSTDSEMYIDEYGLDPEVDREKMWTDDKIDYYWNGIYEKHKAEFSRLKAGAT